MFEQTHFNQRQLKTQIKTFFFLVPQVSTSTGVVSHFVNLQVVVPEAFILGSGELHVDMGSAINLVCIIEKVRQSFVTLIVFRLRVTSDSCPESFRSDPFSGKLLKQLFLTGDLK